MLAGAAASVPATPAARRPNILHIMSDQQQWATIAGRTECRTPHINRLVREGMLYERSYTPSAVCCPARAMMLSGSYHWHNGVYNQVHSSPSVHRDMNPDVVLYSQRLRDAGYRLGYVGKWHASYVRTPLDFGYHEMAGVFGCNPATLKRHDLNPDRVRRAGGPLKRTVVRSMKWPGSEPFPMWGYVDGPEEATAPHYSTDLAIAMMNRFSRGTQPWMLEVHWVEPHDAYMPLKKYLDRYDPRAIKVPRSFQDTFAGKPGLHRRESESWGPVTEDDYRQGRAFYYAYTEQVDAQVGRLLDALEQTGQAGNTLVVFTSDHGDMCGAHRMWIKGWIPYEECYRIPLVMRWPGTIRAGARTSHVVATHELAHTYAQAAGAAPLPHPDGRALQPLFADPARRDWEDQILCAYYGGEFLYTQRMAITDRYKYVFNSFDYDELYDLQKDPEEMHNAVSDPAYREASAEMRGRLYSLMNRYEDPYGDTGVCNPPGEKPNRYGAPRYLAR